jgi:hypothetical protein
MEQDPDLHINDICHRGGNQPKHDNEHLVFQVVIAIALLAGSLVHLCVLENHRPLPNGVPKPPSLPARSGQILLEQSFRRSKRNQQQRRRRQKAVILKWWISKMEMQEGLYWSLYSSIFRYKVVNPIFSNLDASVLFPLV